VRSVREMMCSSEVILIVEPPDHARLYCRDSQVTKFGEQAEEL
jgi:hypothetical protein